MPISLNYIFGRLILSFLVVIGVIVFSYILLITTPGDPAVKWAGNPRGPGATRAIELARQELGLDKPFYVQLISFTYNVLTGNLGLSIKYKLPVNQVIFPRFTATLELLVFTYVLAFSISSILGLYSALKRGSKIDSLIQSCSVVLASTPTFWLGTIILVLLSLTGFIPTGRVSVKLIEETRFIPITGFYMLDSLLQFNIPVFIDTLARLIPPALAISVYPIGVLTRLVRMLIAETLLEDYIKAAIAWGVTSGTIIKRFVLKSIIPPLVQVTGLSFTYSLIDAMVVEAVYDREGLGQLFIAALRASDFRVAIALIIYLTLFYIIVNTIVDILQALVDPRVRL